MRTYCGINDLLSTAKFHIYFITLISSSAIVLMLCADHSMALHIGASLSIVQADAEVQIERIKIRGVRITIGNAVDCPQVRTVNDKVYSISYLAPIIHLGDLIEITGYMANTTTCLGPVLYAEEVRKIEN